MIQTGWEIDRFTTHNMYLNLSHKICKRCFWCVDWRLSWRWHSKIH